MDTLQMMFDAQKEFQLKSGNGEFPRLDGQHSGTFALGLISELGEVLQEYKGWKPWTNSDNYTHNKEACAEELADMWHFMINLSLALNFDADDVAKAFNSKHEKLLRRFAK